MYKLNANILVNGLIALFFVLCLSIHSGYSISPIVLSVFGLGYVIYSFYKKQPWQISADEKQLIYSYAFYCVLILISFILNRGRLNELEPPTKIFFLLTLLLVFRRFPIKLPTLLYAIPAGGMVAGIVALFDRFYFQFSRAYEIRIMSIQGGDIAMSLGMFSLVCGIYFFSQKQSKSMLFCVTGSLLGILGSILSTARGGWIGVPLVVALIFGVYHKQLPKKFFAIILALFIVVIAIASAIPSTKIMDRIYKAEQEIAGYVSDKKGSGSTSIGARFEMWKSAVIMIKEKPFFGWGKIGATQERKAHAKLGLVSPVVSQFSHAHNQYLDDFTKRGVLGFIALLGIFLVPLRFFWKNRTSIPEIKVVATLGIVHIISFMCYSLSQGIFIHNSGYLFYFFLVVVFYGAILHLKKDS
ncbi:MAG: O-antigen ligase [[Actinobacillus] rossii]|nr:O-antigen ligase [[Actinobacillus] rossii]MDY5794011.1 O-antigen ligase [[Actinobacillus] rossii]